MKAAVVNSSAGGFALEEIQIDAPMSHEVLVDVQASGLCHTDLTVSKVGPVPAVLGHEVAGVVSAVGAGVTMVAVGDHVVACGVLSCGACRQCVAGRWVQCLHPEALHRDPGKAPRLSRDGEPVFQGYGLGGFAQQALVHERLLVVIPKEMPFPQASLVGCGVLTGAGAVFNAAKVRPGDTVAIIGIGGVGINAVSASSMSGALRTIAIDIDERKLGRAQLAGATDVVNSSTSDPVDAVLQLTGGTGCDAIIDCVGIPSVIEQAVPMLAKGGCLYLVGVNEIGSRISVDLLTMVQSQKRIQGARMGSNIFKHDIPFYLDLYLHGRWDLDSLVSKEIALNELNEGYAALEEGSVSRVVITEFA
jgi:S-(hydroxymethyl)glutathione dehydrogenase/alcohol dehydrogenase